MKQKHIQHLYWRAGFGVDFKNEEKLQKKTKSKIVSKLFSESKEFIPLELDLSDIAIYKNKTYKELKSEYSKKELVEIQKNIRLKLRDLNSIWIERLTNSNQQLREKMTLFWANVFVCRDNNIFHIQQYNNTLRQHALGNFGDFVKAIAKEPSMSKYLNNRQNIKRSPNENFARELMELFTLGIGNYTEQDIKESARAFTGWSFKESGAFFLRKKHHDYGVKTFFNKTGEFGGDDIIDIILEQRQCAKFICTKIYTYFVNPTVDENRLEEITSIFYKDYNIAKLMKYIFKSKWFYNESNIGVKIKSPIELLVGIQKVVPLQFEKPKQLNYLQKMMGQILLFPENVAGWKGGKSWIDANSLMFRLKLAALLLNKAVINLEEKGEFEDSFEKYYQKTKNRNRFIKTKVNWVSFDKMYQNSSTNDLINNLIVSKIDEDTYSYLKSLQVNSNRNFCVQLMSIPEYQLC